MRASKRRSHHSVSSRPGSVNFPRRIDPLASRRNSALSHFRGRDSSNIVRAALAVIGPLCASHPVTSREQCVLAAKLAACRLPACPAQIERRGNTATNNLRPLRRYPIRASRPHVPAPARRSTTSASQDRRCQIARSLLQSRLQRRRIVRVHRGRAMRSAEHRASSSASRTSGQASARTSSMAAGSSRPISDSTASGNMRRISTARARRSSSGASSRYA